MVSESKQNSLFESLYPHGFTPYKTKWFDILISFILLIIVFIGYIKTLTPSVGAGDNGELVTTLYNMGAGHPPGYPLYGIVGKLFTFLPFGDIAYRVNLFVALSAAGSVLFLYLIAIKLLGMNRDNGKLRLSIHIPAIACSFIFGFSLTHWGQAVGGEVYSLNIFLVSFLLYIMILWYEEMIYFRNEAKIHFADRMTIFLGFVMGLSLTNHQLPVWYIVAYAIILLPSTIFIVIADRSEKFFTEFKNRLLVFGIFIFTILLALYLFYKYGYSNRLLFPKDVPYILIAIFIIPTFTSVYVIVTKVLKLEENWVDRFLEMFSYAFWLLIFAMTIYLYLLIRARALASLPDPKPLSWGDTQTLDILFNHMMRKQYGIGGGGDLNNFGGQFLAVIKFCIEQFHPINFVIAIIGLIYMFFREKIWAIYTLFAMLLFDVALIKFINFEIDPRTLSFQEVFFIQQFFIFAIYIGYGFQLLLDLTSRIRISEV